MTQVDRALLQELADKPIGGIRCNTDDIPHIFDAEAVEGAKRAKAKWLPQGKRATSGREVKAAEKAFYERQIDLEEAVEAAGGQRGSAAA